MSNLLNIYKCAHCGNIVEILHDGGAPLVCCGEPMKEMKAGTSDGAMEKHVPVIEKTATGYKVLVGAVAHPMDEAHYIEWIELIADGKVYRQHLQPGEAPQAEFCIKADHVTAREYCNLHGLWKSEM